MESEEAEVKSAATPKAPQMSANGLLLATSGSFATAVGIMVAVDAIVAGMFSTEFDSLLMTACFAVGLWTLCAGHHRRLEGQAEYLAQLLKAQNTPDAEEPTP